MGIKENIISLFFGKCDIYETRAFTDERGVTKEALQPVYEDVDCRLVFGGRDNYSAQRTASGRAHKNDSVLNVRVFLSPDIYVRAGSIIRVRQNGHFYSLRSTGEGAVYRYHQELMAVPYYSEV